MDNTRKKKGKWRKLITIAGVIAIMALVWIYFEYKSFFKVPDSRLALDQYYPEMLPDDHHHYIPLPIDHNDPKKGKFKGFYMLSPNFVKGGQIAFFLTDGQMELVHTRPDFAFFESILGDVSFVLLGVRGHSPTYFPEVYNKDGTLNYKNAMNLYGSDQLVEDIECTRLDLERKGYLPANGKIMLFGVSGAGVLAQQYLAKYGEHVSRVILGATGAPDIAKENHWLYSPNFSDFNSEGAKILNSILGKRKVDLATLSYILYQAARDRPNARQAQVDILKSLDAHGSLLKFGLKPQYNLSMAKFLMSTPSAACIKVRCYELVGYDLKRYKTRELKTLNLLYEFSAQYLSDFMEKEMAGEIHPKEFQLDRSRFTGEVLVMSGTEDVVFSVETGKAIAAAYPHAKFSLFEDGHRFLRNQRYYQSLRKAFLSGGFNSPEFQRLYNDPCQLNKN